MSTTELPGEHLLGLFVAAAILAYAGKEVSSVFVTWLGEAILVLSAIAMAVEFIASALSEGVW